jgi:DUSP domain
MQTSMNNCKQIDNNRLRGKSPWSLLPGLCNDPLSSELFSTSKPLQEQAPQQQQQPQDTALQQPAADGNSSSADAHALPDGALQSQALQQPSKFVVVPQQLWTALYQWYGGGPVLCRQVRTSKSLQLQLLEVGR